MPPMEGLHDSSPMVSARWVIRAVRAPVRAEAVAASQPACPPPTTMTCSRLIVNVGQQTLQKKGWTRRRLQAVSSLMVSLFFDGSSSWLLFSDTK